MDAKILAAVQKEAPEGLFVHRLTKAVGGGGSGAGLSLRVARAGAEPFWLADLPAAIFTSLLSLSSRKLVSFAPVSAMLAKLEFAQAPQPHPLISLATAPDARATFFLPMRIVIGAPPGTGGFTVVGEGSRFDWHDGAAPEAAKKAAAKGGKKAAPAAKGGKRAAPAAKGGKKALPPAKRKAPPPAKKKAAAAAKKKKVAGSKAAKK
jgi:hypothetical protein